MIALVALLLTACTSTDRDGIRQAARQSVFPDVFPSYEAALDYCGALFAGGRAEPVQLGSVSYLVVIQHGSGRPVLGIALYQQRFERWRRVATDRLQVFDFVHASTSDGKIILTEERSGRIWTLYSPTA
jgi:hypothetical protein